MLVVTENRDDPGQTGASSSRRSRWARAILAALSGLIAGFCALAVAELVAAVVRPESGPVTAVGSAVIDRTPPAVKEFAVRNFGTADKMVLQLGILVLLALFAMGIGMLALRHRLLGSAAVLVFGLVGAVSAVGRPEGVPADALPSVVGAVVAAGVLYLLVGRLKPAPSPSPAAGEGETEAYVTFDRRGFVVAATTAAVTSAGAGFLGRRLTSSVQAGAGASRHNLVLPVPESAAPAIPPGADLRIRGLSSFITPNKDFYRVDTALVVPRVDAGTWRLKIHGTGVARPVTVDIHDLLGREIIERDITLACVSNEVGGPYVGNARWIGVRLADLLREAGVRPPSKGGPADQIVARSVDGMTIGTPVETAMDGRDAMLAFGMNGEPLPFEHGFPVRMVVPGLYGYVSACKWIKDIELTTFDAYDAYWVEQSWSQQAPIKTESRIDTPARSPPRRPARCRWPGWPGPSTAVSRGSRSGWTAGSGTRPGWPPRTTGTPGASGCGSGPPHPAITPSRSVPRTEPAPPRPATASAPCPTARRAGTR